MQLFTSTVTPLDFSRQVKYSCVISLSAAAPKGVLKKSAEPITTTFLVHSRPFATSLLNFGIIVILDNLISDLRTRHRCLRDRDRATAPLHVRHDECADRAVVTPAAKAHMAMVILTRLDLLTLEQVACRDVEPAGNRLHQLFAGDGEAIHTAAAG